MEDLLQFVSTRRFGVEIEINALDGRDNILLEEIPTGIHTVGNVISRTLGEHVEIRRWGPTHWDKSNGCWVVKPDNSCGIEVCSPISKGLYGINKIAHVVQELNAAKIKADNRCSLHIHVDVFDCTTEQLASVIAHWIKCEMVFLDMFPESRKNNKFCQAIGLSDQLHVETEMTPSELIKFVGLHKYTTINTYYFNRGDRPTVEFRIADGSYCLDPLLITNWIKLVLHFVEVTKNLPMPSKYVPNDRWSSYLWLDPDDVVKLLGMEDISTLSLQMRDLRFWFILMCKKHIGNCRVPIHSYLGRQVASKQVIELLNKS